MLSVEDAIFACHNGSQIRHRERRMPPEPSSNAAYPLTEVLLESRPVPAHIEGVVIGTLCGFENGGSPCIDFPGNAAGSLPSPSTVALAPGDRGREVALMFEGGDPRKPIILGLIHHPVPIPAVEVKRDGEKLVFTAEEEIELRCGKASIILTKAGKVIIRGEYLLSRSAGVNRIKGGSVQINSRERTSHAIGQRDETGCQLHYGDGQDGPGVARHRGQGYLRHSGSSRP